MSRCQKELEDNQANLRQQQQLLRSAAGQFLATEGRIIILNSVANNPQ